MGSPRQSRRSTQGFVYPPEKEPESRWSKVLAGARTNAALLTILVTVAIFGGTQFFSSWQANKTQVNSNSEAQKNRDNQQEIENQKVQENELQTYLDDAGKLLNEQSASTQGDREREALGLLQAKTTAVLQRLDTSRKQILLRFLYDTNYISYEEPSIRLRNVDFSGVNLAGTDLEDINLNDTYLRDADLSNYTKLAGAYMGAVDLSGANLSNAALNGSYLRGSYLMGTNLQGANLSSADLYCADLRSEEDSNLGGADLRGAIGLTQEQIDQAIGDRWTQIPDAFQRPDKWGEDGAERKKECDSSEK